MDPLHQACLYLEKIDQDILDLVKFYLNGYFLFFPKLIINKKDFLAACYLHDTFWQAHPDYRSEVCFETVTGANLGGIDHSGRIF